MMASVESGGEGTAGAKNLIPALGGVLVPFMAIVLFRVVPAWGLWPQFALRGGVGLVVFGGIVLLCSKVRSAPGCFVLSFCAGLLGFYPFVFI